MFVALVSEPGTKQKKKRESDKTKRRKLEKRGNLLVSGEVCGVDWNGTGLHSIYGQWAGEVVWGCIVYPCVCVCVSVDRTPGVLERHLIDGLNALIGCETRGWHAPPKCVYPWACVNMCVGPLYLPCVSWYRFPCQTFPSRGIQSLQFRTSDNSWGEAFDK